MKSSGWLLLAGAALAGIVLVARLGSGAHPTERRILFYQDSMHPWIKLDHPGKCTICSMDLTPIYEGEAAAVLGDDVVALSPDNVTVMNVQTEPVVRRTLELTLRVAGTLEANETRKTVLAAPAAGRVEVLNVDYAGVEVTEGQVLVTFYSPELALEKRRYLVRSRMSTSRDPYASTPTSALDLAKVSVEADPYFQDLIAPQSGTVLDRNVYPGQYVAEGDHLFTIADSSVLWFRFDVYENQLGWVASGQRVDVVVAALPGRSFPATIAFIEPTLDPVSRTVKVRADIENPEIDLGGGHRMRLLRYGMYADGLIRVEVPDVLTVSRSAILMPGSKAFAYVDRGGGAYERRRVVIGRQGDRQWEVLRGLEEGDRVVTVGNVLIDAQAQFLQRDEADDDGAGDLPPAELGSPPGVGLMAMGTAASPAVALAPPQEAALGGLIQAADALAQALAADDLPGARTRLAALPAAVRPLTEVFPTGHPWHEYAERLSGQVAEVVPADLAQARKIFVPWSAAMVAWAQEIRRQPGPWESLTVYHCPMAPKPGLWMQRHGPLRNPFFGAKMLACGEEVPPLQRVAVRPTQGSPDHHPTPLMAAPAVNEKPVMGQTTPAAPAGQEVGGDPVLPVTMPERVQAPQLPQQAGPGIRSGRRSTGMAFWQRAAELYSSTGQEATPTNSPTAPQPPPEDEAAAVRFVAGAAGLSAALAADDLPAFNRAMSDLTNALPALEQTFAAPHPWNPLVRKLSLASRGGGATDLEGARRRFLPLSVNVVEFSRRLREDEPTFAGLKIYHCPMAPEPGLWMQLEGPLRNPFYGARMLECGEEVHP